MRQVSLARGTLAGVQPSVTDHLRGLAAALGAGAGAGLALPTVDLVVWFMVLAFPLCLVDIWMPQVPSLLGAKDIHSSQLDGLCGPLWRQSRINTARTGLASAPAMRSGKAESVYAPGSTWDKTRPSRFAMPHFSKA